MTFAERPLRDLLAELAAREPVPGGGAAAAWSCALAAGLVEMAAAFGSLDAVGAEAAGLRAEALALAERDGEAYAAVLAATRLNRDDPSRGAQLAEALSRAAQPPLEIALAAERVAALAGVALREGSPHLRGDATASAAIAGGAAEAAAALVEVNVGDREPPDPRVAQAREVAARARGA